MDFTNRLSLFIALGCLLFIVYDVSRPRTFSENEQVQMEEIVQRSIDTHLAIFNSELEVQANALLRQKRTLLTLDAKKQNANELVNMSVRIASDAQAWKLKPQAFGGGQKNAGFEGVSLEQLGYDVDKGGRYATSTGICELDLGTPSDRLFVVCSNKSMGTIVRITLSGTHPDDIQTRILNIVNSDEP